MRLTKNYQYALLLALYLTRSGMARIKDVAANLELSHAMLDQVARKMRVKGILASARGPGGGFTIVGSPTIVQVLRSVGRPSLLSSGEELSLRRSTSIEDRTLLHIVGGITSGMSAFLKTKISDIGASVVQSELGQLDKMLMPENVS